MSGLGGLCMEKPDEGSNEDEVENGFRYYRTLHRGSGWQAHFTIGGIKHFRYFSDALYGSPEAARRAAEQFGVQNRELHRELLALRRRFEVRRNSRSGVPGVCRYWGDSKRGPYWSAKWTDEAGRAVSRKFSISRLGEEKAFQLAVRAREKAVGRLRQRYRHLLRSFGVASED